MSAHDWFIVGFTVGALLGASFVWIAVARTVRKIRREA